MNANLRNKKIFFVIMVLSLFVSMQILTGCETSRKTVRTETTTQGDTTVTETAPTTVETTTTEVEHHDEDRGLLGSTVHFVGQVIAFPFKLIGKMFEAIF